MSHSIVAWHLYSGAEQFAYLRLEPEIHTLDEGTQRLPSGGYTTFRTFHHYGVLRLAEHFNRLEETARLAGKPVRLDRESLRQALHTAFAEYPSDEMRVRLILDLEQQIGDIYLLVDVVHIPAKADYEQGVKVVTQKMHRKNAKAKLTRFIATASVIREQLPDGVNEVIMISEDGHLLEGLSSNVFAVLEGTVWTAEQDVLSGITRSQVLDVIHAEGIPLNLQGVPMGELSNISELFITSASRAVLPVTEIDGKRVGNGVPGPVTLRLLNGYHQRIEQDLDFV